MECPALDAIQSLLISDDMAPDLVEHVRCCRNCQSVLERLTSDRELQNWSPKQPDPFASEAACQTLVARLRRMDRVRLFVSPEVRPSDTARPVFADSKVPGELGELDHYRIIRELGRGGMSIVYEAYDQQLGRAVAIKLLREHPNDTVARARFAREAMAIAAINHPNVISIYGVQAREVGHAYFAMELVRGPTLRDWITQNRPMDFRQAVRWIAAVADALAAAHAVGIVHRDVKPGNILLKPLADDIRPSKGELRVKLADFGLARSLDSNSDLTRSDFMGGTPAYLSPEQVALQPAGSRSDIYSLGVTFFECLTGELPFRGAPHAVLQQIEVGEFSSPRRLNPAIPLDLETICLKAMHQRPASRYASAAEFAADLRRWLNGEPIHARPISNFERTWRWVRRNRRVALLGGVVVSLLTTLACGALWATYSISLAKRQAETEADRAIQARQASDESARRAREQRQLALDSLGDLIHKVQKQLTGQDAVLRLREDLLRTALAGLEKIAANDNAEDVDHATIDARIQSAELLATLGDSQGSKDQLKLARQLAESACQKFPANAEYLRDLGNVLALEIDALFRVFAHSESRSMCQRLLEIRQQVAEVLPDDVNAKRAVIAAHQRLADLDWLDGKSDETAEKFQHIVAELQKLAAIAPDIPNLQRDLYVVHNRLGMAWTASGKLDLGREALGKGLAMVERLSTENPDNVTYRSDLANTISQLARLESASRNFDQAKDLASRAVALYQASAAKNPENVTAQMLVGTSLDLVYQVHASAGHFGAAEEAAQACLKQYEAAIKLDPNSSRYLMLAAEAAGRILQVKIRQAAFEELIHWTNVIIDYCERCKKTADYTPANQGIQDYYQAMLVVLKLASKGEEYVKHLSAKQTAESRVALGFIAYRSALAGSPQHAVELAELISKDLSDLDESPKVIQRWYVELLIARVFAVAGRHLREASERSPSDTMARSANDLLQRSRDICNELMKTYPALRAEFERDYDFWRE